LEPKRRAVGLLGLRQAVKFDGFLQPGMEMITKPFDLENLSQRIRAMVSS